MKPFKQTHRALVSRQTKLDQDIEAALRAAGWQYTSDFPDHCWRWCKQIISGRVTCSHADEALSVELALQEFKQYAQTALYDRNVLALLHSAGEITDEQRERLIQETVDTAPVTEVADQ